MVTLWIGDFRIKQIQKMSKAIQQTTQYYFLTDDTADVTWLEDSVTKQIPRLALESANVILALGFMDCVYSCLWDTFTVDHSIEQYTKTIVKLKKEHPNFKFYFCAVNPIGADYYFAGSKIKQSVLTNKIKLFNNKIKKLDTITFIDSYTYLAEANFTTRDGVCFTSQTCEVLHSYIKNITGFSFNLDKAGLCTANSYNIHIDDMKPNARYIYQYLTNSGWTLNAIAALLGNVQVESKMSPWMWQGTIDGSIINDDETHSLNMAVLAGKNPGYGLVQWTPYSKYVDWCITTGLSYWDIDSQLQRICWEVNATGADAQWQVRESKGYNLTFKEFIKSTEDSYWLAGAFAFCYERSGSSTGTEEEQNNLKIERGNNAKYWYEYLNSLHFEDTEPSTTSDSIPQPILKVKDCFTGKLNKTTSLSLNR